MTDVHRDPPFTVFPASLAATVVPAALGALVSPILEPNGGGAALAAMVFVFGLMIAALHVLILGAPLYLLLRRRGPVRWTTALVAGAAIGALPFILLFGRNAGGDDSIWFGAAALLGMCGALAFSWTVKRLS